MRFPWTNKLESDPDWSAQEEFWCQWERLSDRSLSEIEEPEEARQFLSLKLRELTANRDFEATCELLRHGVERFPEDTLLRFMLVTVLQQLGNEAESLVELGILLATRPDYHVAHTHLARRLLKQERREEARAVLEAGWRYAQHKYRRRELAVRKSEFFSILDHPAPVATEEGDP